MDSFSDSSRCELDSVTSTDSMQLIADEFLLHRTSTPDVSNADSSKRLASLELENERLRVDLENVRIELDAKIASNQGLKDKITELYVEAQVALQEKHKLQNALKDANGRCIAAENSSKWYQAQLHDLQANKKALQLENDTYRAMARQRQQTIFDLTARCRELTEDYTKLIRQFKSEKQELRDEIGTLRSESGDGGATTKIPDLSLKCPSPDLSTKLEATEEELRDTRTQLKAIERRLLSCEVAKTSIEKALDKHRELISSMEENAQAYEYEKNSTIARYEEAQLEVRKLRSENQVLQTTLLSSKQEQSQVEQAIVQLRSQLLKMIERHKLFKSRNIELEEKLVALQEVKNENKRLRLLTFAANGALFRKLREAKRTIKLQERQLRRESFERKFGDTKENTDGTLRECLKRALEREKDLKEQLKSISKIPEESVDEGYGDGSTRSNASFGVDLPSPPPLDPVLLRSVSKVLSSGKNLLAPVETDLNELCVRLDEFRRKHCSRLYASSPLPCHTRQLEPVPIAGM